MKIYISGPIERSEECFKKFDEAAAALEKAGYEPINPARSLEPDDSKTWMAGMAEAFNLMAENGVNGVAVLDTENGKSKRSILESEAARAAQIPVKTLAEWVHERDTEIIACPRCGWPVGTGVKTDNGKWVIRDENGEFIMVGPIAETYCLACYKEIREFVESPVEVHGGQLLKARAQVMEGKRPSRTPRLEAGRQ